MSVPAASSDSKTAHLLQNEEQPQQPVEAPPSYTAASSKPIVIGDGNVFSDLPRPGMTYGAGQRQDYVPRAERKGTWSFGLFDCFSDPGATAKACCCPCISYGQTRHRLHAPDAEAPVCSTPCLGYCLTLSFMPGAESIFGLLNRNELRMKLDINQPARESTIRLPGGRRAVQENSNTMFEGLQTAAGFLDDAWKHFFCGCCALVQEDREVRSWVREMQEGGLGDLGVAGEEGFDADAPVYGDQDDGVRAEGERLLGDEGVLRGLRG